VNADPPAQKAAETGAHEAEEPDWMIWLEDVDFCPLMDCDPRPTPRMIIGRVGGVTIAGSLSRGVIQRYVRQQSNRYRSCYERGLNANAELSGRVTLRFLIDHEGEVRAAQVAASSLGDHAVEECVLETVRGIHFPASEARGATLVTYPIVFQRSNSMALTPREPRR
jgi:TonB family protein